MRDIHEQLEQRSSRAKLKQRLVGGAVLLIVLAIFLPFIFNHSHLGANATVGQDSSASASMATDNATDQTVQTSDQTAQTSQAPLNSAAQSVDSSAAAQDEMAATDQTIESDEAIQATDTTTQTSATEAQGAAAATQEQASAPASAAAPAPAAEQQSAQTAAQQAAPSAKPVAAAQAKAQPAVQKAAAGHWVVQVASFSDPAHAKQLVTDLRHKGLHAYSQQVSPRLTRVYVGPVKTQQEAQAVQAQVKDEFQLNGLALKK